VDDYDKHVSLLHYKMVTAVKGFISQDLGSDRLRVSVLKFEERPRYILLIHVQRNNKKRFLEIQESKTNKDL
jgi:hypothetical protein